MAILHMLSPAKINLFLHILDRREDGYHNVQTLFQFIDLCDELTFEATTDERLTLTGDTLNLALSENLISKAYHLFKPYRRQNAGIKVDIKKRIPMGGGLGGGSSNAATTMVALNQLWGLNFSRQDLQTKGLSLGADVPIFLFGESAWAEGVGERFEAMKLPTPWFLVIHPGCSVPTKAVFQHKDLTRHSEPIKIRAFQAEMGRNDCESLVKRLYPKVQNAIQWLSQFAPARMSGTGSTVFARFSTQDEAQSVLERLPEHFEGYVVRGLNRSPLYAGCSVSTNK